MQPWVIDRLEIFRVFREIARRALLTSRVPCKVPCDPVISARATVINPVFASVVFCASDEEIWEMEEPREGDGGSDEVSGYHLSFYSLN